VSPPALFIHGIDADRIGQAQFQGRVLLPAARKINCFSRDAIPLEANGRPGSLDRLLPAADDLNMISQGISVPDARSRRCWLPFVGLTAMAGRGVHGATMRFRATSPRPAQASPRPAAANEPPPQAQSQHGGKPRGRTPPRCSSATVRFGTALLFFFFLGRGNDDVTVEVPGGIQSSRWSAETGRASHADGARVDGRLVVTGRRKRCGSGSRRRGSAWATFPRRRAAGPAR